MNDFYRPKRAMVIAAHPDDIEFLVAGTVARWVRAGAQLCYVLCTSGDAGIAEAAMRREEVIAIREAEQRAAAAVIGVREVVFLREPDGLVEPTLALRKKLVREIRRFQPEAVICGDPTLVWFSPTYVNHPDHRAAAEAALAAVFPTAGQPHLFAELAAEGLAAHKVRKLYVEAWLGGDTFVDITETIDLKIAALKQHVSQVQQIDPEQFVRHWGKVQAQGQAMEYAEAFRVITLLSDDE